MRCFSLLPLPLLLPVFGAALRRVAVLAGALPRLAAPFGKPTRRL